MQNLLVFTAVLASISAVLGSERESWCRCSLMINYEESIIMVFEFPEISIDDCGDDGTCRSKCEEMVDEHTGDGSNIDIWAGDGHGHTVGSHICEYIYETEKIPFIFNKIVYGYFEVCGGSWVYTEQFSKDMLCCNLGVHEHCVG